MLSVAVVNELVHKGDVVYHFAGAVGVRLIVEQPVKTLFTNVQGAEVVLDHCSRFGKRVLVASTSEVYGDHREELPLGESARRTYGPTTTRRWAYADSKAMDEFLALAYHQERDLDCVIVRLFNTVDPRQSGTYGIVIPRFVERALTGSPLEIHGEDTQTRCFCHVEDTVRALIGLMDIPSASGEIYNLGSQERIRSSIWRPGFSRLPGQAPSSSSSRTNASTGRRSRHVFTEFHRSRKSPWRSTRPQSESSMRFSAT